MRVNLSSIVGTIASTYNGGLTSSNLHDFIILVTLSIGTSGYNEIQMIIPIGTSGYNISEYIPKLQNINIMDHEQISYHHILRHLNTVADSLANFVLDWSIDSVKIRR